MDTTLSVKINEVKSKQNEIIDNVKSNRKTLSEIAPAVDHNRKTLNSISERLDKAIITIDSISDRQPCSEVRKELDKMKGEAALLYIKAGELGRSSPPAGPLKIKSIGNR